MNRWDAYNFTCAILRANLNGQQLQIPGDVEWPIVISVASRHMVIPMMAPVLVDHPNVDAETREYFVAVQAIAAQRSDEQLSAIREIVPILPAVEARPVLLKGAAGLAQGLYNARGPRLMSDIDILIDLSKMNAAKQALFELGYCSRKPPVQWVRDEVGPRHEETLYHSVTNTILELHHELTAPANAMILPGGAALGRAVEMAHDGFNFSVLAPTDRVTHHILHEQINNKGGDRKLVDLRQLTDMALLVDALGAEIDWPSVREKFSTNGHERAFEEYLTYLAILLDRHIPGEMTEPGPLLERLREGVDKQEGKLDLIRTIASDFFQRVRRRPALLINLLQPGLWRSRILTWRQRWISKF